MEQIKKVTFDVIIPIGMVLALLTGFYQLGKIAKQVEVNTASIDKVSSNMESFPTRTEFTSLLEDVKYIRNNLAK